MPNTLPHVACVIDHDNLCHAGCTPISHLPIPQAVLHVVDFARALRSSGIVDRIVCRNRCFTATAEKMWVQLGFRVMATNRNCDTDVIRCLKGFVQVGFRHLILASGDADYVDALHEIRRTGVRVEIWTRRCKASGKLIEAADAVRFIDQFVTPPLRPAA